ncbi:HVO_0234 family beta-propeller protein [Halobaculum sp. P14]|uniref:HVO_0234 family beta-propeller protein n=1 Tax=Halobaculum sp. P14 TaxID=3421638 RepID=UPI003EBCC847
MPTIDEKRVYDAKTGATRALVASTVGVVGAKVSGDIVGEFGIDHRCSARDLAAAGDVLAVATDDDVLVGDFEPSGHGPAVAVGVDAGSDAVLAAAPDGTISRLAGDADEWAAVGAVDDPRRIAGTLVAAADGVHRVRDGDVEYAGLDDARDVAGGGAPLAVTGEALYALGNGWMRDLDGDFRAVATDAAGDRAVAATGDELYERGGRDAEDGDTDGSAWVAAAESGVADVAVGDDLLAAVTADGELRVNRDGEWRGRHLGVPGASAVVVPGASGGRAE